MSKGRSVVLTATCALAAVAAGAQESLPTRLPEQGFTPRQVERTLSPPKERADDVREDALSIASVWAEPAVPIAAADLGRTPGAFYDPPVCVFQPAAPRAATPKFDCVSADGEVLKVKYKGPEVRTETAAARLLSALGFGADAMYLVPKLRCFGCPADPWSANANTPVERRGFTDFTAVSVERRVPGLAIADDDGKDGWGWEALDKGQARRTR